MKSKLIGQYLAKAAHFRALADPDTNHLLATGATSMLPAKAAERAQYWEDRAAVLIAEGLAARGKRKNAKT